MKQDSTCSVGAHITVVVPSYAFFSEVGYALSYASLEAIDHVETLGSLLAASKLS